MATGLTRRPRARDYAQHLDPHLQSRARRGPTPSTHEARWRRLRAPVVAAGSAITHRAACGQREARRGARGARGRSGRAAGPAHQVAMAPGSRAHERGAQLPRVAQGGGLQAQGGGQPARAAERPRRSSLLRASGGSQDRPRVRRASGGPACTHALRRPRPRAVDAGARGAGLETSGGCCLRRKWRLE